MAKINSFLAERLKAPIEKLSKMSNLAELSSRGELSGFAGVFKVSALNEEETERLRSLLEEHFSEEGDIEIDLNQLASLTSEVKAISNQAVILHGERIKKAQEILKKYKEGAFTSWLLQTYGNRQTPYNFLQYFELCKQLSPPLLPKLDAMPRQAVYTLACRKGEVSEKESIIRNYQGETKEALLESIRKTFPLPSDDKRKADGAASLLKNLEKICSSLQNEAPNLSDKQRKKAENLLSKIQQILDARGANHG